jgi:parallel beta-helix repeat protein
MRMKIASFTIVFVLVFSMIVVFDESFKVVTKVSGATIDVYDEPMNYDEIQEAINTASDDDTIVVHDGTYAPFVVNKRLTIETSGSVMIDGDVAGGSNGITILSDWVSVSGFTITRLGFSHGIVVSSANCSVFSNTISDCGNEEGDYGIYLTSSAADNHVSSNTIEDIPTCIYLSSSDRNTISGNYITIPWYKAIHLDSSDDNIVSSNTLYYGGPHGIYLSSSSENEIDGNTVEYFGGTGIHLRESSNENTIERNEIYDLMNGIEIVNSDGNTMSENTIAEVDPELNFINGISLWNANNNNITENEIDTGSTYGIYLSSSSGNNIGRNDVSGYMINIQLSGSSEDNYIFNNILKYSDVCIMIESNSNDIDGNTITLTGHCAIWVSSANFVNITNNHISDRYANGIILENSNYIDVQGNDVFFNYDAPWNPKAIHLIETTFSTISINLIWNNTNGIYLESSGNNEVYHNSIIGNDIQAFDDNNSNTWDNGYPSGGNFWSDYNGSDFLSGPNQDMPGSDGFGDTPYVIDSDSQDNYPLMDPKGNFSFLRPGWNLVSSPRIQDDEQLENALTQLNGFYEAVQWFNASNSQDHWEHYHILKPSHLNDMDEIDHNKGFFIFIDDPIGDIFEFTGNDPLQNQNITMVKGWNMVGYPSLSNKLRSGALNNLDFGTEVDAIWTYNSGAKKWEEVGELNYFVMGKGYWIHTTTDCVWEVSL